MLSTLVKFETVFHLLYKCQKGHSTILEIPEGPQSNYVPEKMNLFKKEMCKIAS